MADELVTIATFGTTTDAHLARMRLESVGIDCFLDNENIVDANWLWSTAVGGVKVKVRRSDAKAAVDALQMHVADEDVEASSAPPCPTCGCTTVFYQRISPRKAILSLFLLGFPLPFIKPTWKCRDCRREWSVGDGSGKNAPPRDPPVPRRVFRVMVYVFVCLAALGLGVLLMNLVWTFM